MENAWATGIGTAGRVRIADSPVPDAPASHVCYRVLFLSCPLSGVCPCSSDVLCLTSFLFPLVKFSVVPVTD